MRFNELKEGDKFIFAGFEWVKNTKEETGWNAMNTEKNMCIKVFPNEEVLMAVEFGDLEVGDIFTYEGENYKKIKPQHENGSFNSVRLDYSETIYLLDDNLVLV